MDEKNSKIYRQNCVKSSSRNGAAIYCSIHGILVPTVNCIMSNSHSIFDSNVGQIIWPQLLKTIIRDQSQKFKTNQSFCKPEQRT